MKQIKKTIPNAFIKSKTLQLALGVVATLAISNQSNAQNTSYDVDAIPVNGIHNCAIGAGAMSSSVTGAVENTAVGIFSLLSNTTGYHNTATGYQSLYTNTTGDDNVANGHGALWHNTTGYYNVGVGTGTLSLIAAGHDNVAIGFGAISSVSTGGTATGYQNVGVGSNALAYNLSGNNNTANGFNTLYSNTSGGDNVATGFNSLYSNISGFNNVACGSKSSYLTTKGTNSAAFGYGALYSNVTGTYCTGIGCLAGVATDGLQNAAAFGSEAVVDASDKVRIGASFITVVEGPVIYTVSDGRFKTNVKEEDVKGLEFIKKLRPVVYNFDTKKLTEFWTKDMPEDIHKQYMDHDFTASTNIRQSGFIAQEVESAAKDVNYNFNGVHVPENEHDNYSIAYGEFVVPLVKGMQEQQKMIEDQKMMIEEQKLINDKLQQQINDLQKGIGCTTGINENVLGGAYMEQNMPNPFSRETVIKFSLPDQIKSAFMTVYDLSGKQIKTLPINQRGPSSITLTSDQLEAGIYIYSIMADGKLLDSKRMVVAGK